MDFGIIFSLVGLAIKEREKFLEPTFYGKISDIINELNDEQEISIELMGDFFSSSKIREFLEQFIKKGISRNIDEFKIELIQFCHIKNIKIDVDLFINKMQYKIENTMSKNMLDKIILGYSQKIKTDTESILTNQNEVKNEFREINRKIDEILLKESEIFDKIGIKIEQTKEITTIPTEIKQTVENYEKIIEESEQMLHDKKFMKIHTLDELTKRGVYYMHIRNRKKALEIFEIILDVNPKNIAALNNKGIILHDEGDYEGALNCYDTAIEIEPLMVVPYLCAGALLDMQKKYDKAMKYYTKAIELEPRNILTMYNIAHVLKSSERIQESLEWAKKALDIDPKFYPMIVLKGTNHAMLKEYNKARKCFEKALESESEYDIAMRNLEVLNIEEMNNNKK